MPDEMVRYYYRKLFSLSASEYEAEPIDQFFTNLHIWGQIQEKNRISQKHGTS